MKIPKLVKNAADHIKARRQEGTGKEERHRLIGRQVYRYVQRTVLTHSVV